MRIGATLGIVALLLLGLAVAAWRHRASAPSRDPDAAVLEQLKNAGSDLTKVHAPEFFLYFPLEAAAREAARRLESEGYVVTVKPSAGGDGTWLCLATKSMVPRHETLIAIRRKLEALATGLGGEYDGWGTPIVHMDSGAAQQ